MKSLFRTPVPALEGREALRALSIRGPHRVMRGDLGLIGKPGVVYTPERGVGLPAVAFAHDWITGVEHYRRLLEHLASWGIVAIAPNSERGPLPSHLGFAGDLLTALDVSVGVRLGGGEISVSPRRLGLVGHGMGGSVAVLAAARRPVAAVAALFPAPSAPSAESAAAALNTPLLVVAGQQDIDSGLSNARSLAAAHGGPARLAAVHGASQLGIVEGRRVLTALGVGGRERKTITVTHALLTGYLLATLAGEQKYRAFAEPELASLPQLTVLDPAAEPEPPAPPSKLAVARMLVGR